jgi:hypothetical protein
MKENSFSAMMVENISHYKQQYNNLNNSGHQYNDFGTNNRIFDDDDIRKNIDGQINFVKIFVLKLVKK